MRKVTSKEWKPGATVQSQEPEASCRLRSPDWSALYGCGGGALGGPGADPVADPVPGGPVLEVRWPGVPRQPHSRRAAPRASMRMRGDAGGPGKGLSAV